MKIGILTQPLHTNYGGLLQNYALQQVLIEAGHEVETIDWKPSKSLHGRLNRCIRYLESMILPRKYNAPKYIPTNKENSILQCNTNHFIQTYINRIGPMSSKSDFIKQARIGKYDGYVVGSDQCWRPRYNAFLTSMFLDFTKGQNVKRVSYAASFGTEQWEYSSDQSKICSSLSQMFDFISVREESGIKLCKEFLGVDAVHVIDPTMLLTQEKYTKLIEAEHESKATGSLFNYILDPNKEKLEFIDNIAHVTGLTAFQVLPKYQVETRTKYDIKNHIDDCVFPRVTAWLRAFMDAEMVVCDSFHGCVFSIIFNKPFWVIRNDGRGNTRFDSLLKTFGLQDRLVSLRDEIDVMCEIDWSKVNAILDEKRAYSKSLLLNALK